MKLLLLGAGIRTPLMIHGLLRRAELLQLEEIRMFDDDAARLDVMHWLASQIVEHEGAQLSIGKFTSLDEAAADVDFIFSAIRVGQEAGRVADERIALELGVLGQETTGAGGFSMALRTIPVLLAYAEVIERVAPDAWFVNFTNPAGLITQALCNETTLKVIGICDTPTAMRSSISTCLGRDMNDVFIDYVGLNHLGWVRSVLVEDREVLPDLITRYDDLCAAGHEWNLFEPELIHNLGMLPNEYLYYFYYRERAFDHIRESGATRGMQIQAINTPLWEKLTESFRDHHYDEAIIAYANAMLSRDASYMARESGHAIEERTADDASAALRLFQSEGYAGLAMDVMQAIVQDRRAVLILNVRNNGAVSELLPEDVIETVCMVDRHGVRAFAQQALPPVIVPLIGAVKTYERLTVSAAVHGDREDAYRALTVHPLVNSWSLAKQLVDRYLEAHAALLPQFQSEREGYTQAR